MKSPDTSNDERLFPTKRSRLIFGAYISLFVSQGLLVTQVQKNRIYGFNAPIIVLLTEFVKLGICVCAYLTRSQEGWTALVRDVISNKKLLLLYMVPATLYCFYNNLMFVNLRLFDVSTYYCLMQFRIVLTAVIYQLLFRRHLTVVQWASLLTLTTGCLIKEYGMFNNKTRSSPTGEQTTRLITTAKNSTISNGSLLSLSDHGALSHEEQTEQRPELEFMWSTGLLLFQMFCSCFAGVYNEYLLKDSSTAQSTDIILQNIFMYVDSIICNLIAYILSSKSDIPSDVGLVTILKNLLTSPWVLLLIMNNALSGLVASLFLKSLNSILKTFASALELFAVTFLAWILFGNQVDLHTIVALVFVSVATFIYSNNPVSVAPPDNRPQINSREGFVLLPMIDN